LSGDLPVVTTALAGHPPPLLLRDGEVRELGTYGALLGVFDRVELTPTTDALREGDIVLAYTDGLIEHQGPTPFGEPELRALLQSCAGLDGETTANRITNRVVDLRTAESSEDDVAFLVLAVPRVRSTTTPGGSHHETDGEGAVHMVRTAEFPPETTSPGSARAFIEKVLVAWSCSDDVEVAQLLVSELVGNAVQHARSAARVTASLSGDRIHVAVADENPSLPIERRGGPLAPNGRGLLILEALADSWGVDDVEDGRGKVVWFEIPRSRPGSPAVAAPASPRR
jgi:anti-sigma regulatory factor (Ser/Thr protein kinase)